MMSDIVASMGMNPWIFTNSGRKLHILDIKPEEICIEDIAHSLSMNARFNGHIDRFYSVAEHCVEVSRRVPEEFALYGLLHDASEAYLPDFPSPFKRLVVGFTVLEDQVLKRVFNKYGLEFPIPPEVDYVDKTIVAWEAINLFNVTPHWALERDTGEYTYSVQALSPERAKKYYLARFYELTGEKK